MMIKLQKTFDGSGEVSGITFEKIQETKNGYIYKRSDGLFEVFEKRTQKEGTRTICGVDVNFEEKELYPKSNAFGIWAWECATLENANFRLRELENTNVHAKVV